VTLRLMAVHAHPDDESSKGAASYAYYVAQGVQVMIVSCTGGERGDILNEAIDELPLARRDLAGLRRREMARAAAVLGVQHRWLGYRDSGMPREDGTVPALSFADIPVEVSGGVLVGLVREFRPQVLIGYDEQGGYPHPDHIRAHEVAKLAFERAGDPAAYPEAGPAWQVSKLYYDEIFNGPRITALIDGVRERDPQSPLLASMEEIFSWRGERPSLATTHVNVAAYFETRDAALRAHASQVAPDGPFFLWPLEVQREYWPYEDYRLAASRVATTDPEDDLFAGIVEDEA